MLVMRVFWIYLAIGAAWQLFWLLYGTRRFGDYSFMRTLRIMLGRWWLAKVLISTVLWPIGVFVYLTTLDRALVRKLYAREIVEHQEHMRGRCPDCGGPLDAHTHDEPSIH